MTDVDQKSNESDTDDPNKIIDAVSCLDYLKRREVFLYKMMNDPSHKAMLYFLEVLMNADAPVTVDQLAARFSYKTFSSEMRDACGGGSSEGLKEFLQRYPSLFTVRGNGQVTSVAIELPGLESFQEGLIDGIDSYSISNSSSKDGCPESNINRTTKRLSNRVHKSNKRATDLFSNDYCATNRFRSTSTLSLTSLKSVNSSNSSSESPSFLCSNATESIGCQKRERPNETEHVRNNYIVDSTNSNLYRRISNPSITNWTKSSGVYQPPQLRELAKQVHVKKLHCDICPSANVPINSHVSGSTCLHCPLISLTCHHHCPSISHHHPPLCCHCTTNSLNASAHCHSHCSSSALASNSINAIRPSSMHVDYCALPPMEKLMLETEAVKFFQQRLLKREERWVPIKSLAGHLSQASSEIRAMVGPQLEFRRFLLKHPQVFEVQGELVSVKDLFYGLSNQRKPRDRFFSTHFSQSSTNLAATNNISRIGTTDKPMRPKSMIFTQYANPTLPPLISSNAPDVSRRKSDHLRSNHSSENIVTSAYDALHGSTNTVATNPTRINQTWHASNETESRLKQDQTVEHFKKSSTSSDLVPNGAMTSSTELELTTASSFVASSQTLNSLSINMSAAEYRAVMFLRRVLEKQGGAPRQPGISLNSLMHIISTKAPETVQLTIGWTKIELEEFINQHTLFFQIFNNPRGDELSTNGSDQQPSESVNRSSAKYVGNKRLQRMINIIITGSKPNDSTARTLTNHCGRIFHVAKLWGIIDLGKHEHVFFDKSIFKHLDDLQKHFTVNELLYFNAIQAPKESRAKWRATQVWKECDREYMEKMSLQGTHLNLFHTNKSVSNSLHINTCDVNTEQRIPSYYSECASNEDTEADEDLELDSERHVIGSGFTGDEDNDLANLSDNEFDDVTEEDPLLSAVAREEGLNLANDVKFLADEEYDMFNDVSLENGTSEKENSTEWHNDKAKNNDNIVTSTSCNTSDKFRKNNSTHNRKYDGCFEQKWRENPSQNAVTSSTECAYQHENIISQNKLNASKRSSELNSSSSGVSIAVQTLSTGDIMATLLYHDLSKQ